MPRRAHAHLRLVTSPSWEPLCPIRLAYEGALTDWFGALAEVDECAAVRTFMDHEPPDRVYAGLFGDPVARRLIAFTFGTGHADPARYATLRRYVDLRRDGRYLIGLGHALEREGVPLRWTRMLLKKLQALWLAHDAKLCGDTRDVAAIARELEDEEIPRTRTTRDGEETRQRLRTPFGAVFTCVALDKRDGTKHEDYQWAFPADVDPAAWRVAVEQATVRHMQLWSRRRRMNDEYFTQRGHIRRTLTIRRDGRLLERRVLGALPNYEPLVVHDTAAAR